MWFFGGRIFLILIGLELFRIIFFFLEIFGFGISIVGGLVRRYLILEVVFEVKILEFIFFIC